LLENCMKIILHNKDKIDTKEFISKFS